MARKFEDFEVENAANTLIEAKKVRRDKDLHKAALQVIVKRQSIQTLVLKDKR